MGAEQQTEVRITYETLYELMRLEKNREEMQKLPSNFIQDTLLYLSQKEKIVADARKKFDLFSASEREKTEIQLKNIKKILKELYEKRESKILNMALNKSRTNTNLIDLSSLLPEERILFDALVTSLNNGRKGIVNNILQGRLPEVVQRQPGPSQTIVRKVGERLPPRTTPTQEPTTNNTPSQVQKEEPSPVVHEKETPTNAGVQETQTIPSPPKTPTKSVKFTDDVPKFVGAELEEYGPFNKDETKVLPEEIADVLISAGKAVAQ